MTPLIESVARHLVPWLITYAVHSTLILGAALLVTRFLIRDSRNRELVLKLAIVGSLLTPAAQMVAGSGPTVLRFAVPTVTPPATPQSREMRVEVTTADPFPALSGADAAAPGQLQAHVEMLPRSEAADPIGWPGVLLLVWLAGSAGLATHWLLRWRQFLHTIADRREITQGSLIERTRLLQHRAGLCRPISLQVSDHITDIIAFGRSSICVPRRLLPDLEEQERDSALAHEIAHLKRLDPMWTLATQALALILFFQPLLRLASRRLTEEAEFLCDEWAVDQTGQPEALARSLVKIALLREREAPIPAPVAGMTHKEATVLERARRILGGRENPARGHRAWISVVIGTAVLLAIAWIAPRAIMVETRPMGRSVGDLHRFMSAMRGSTQRARSASIARTEDEEQQRVTIHQREDGVIEWRYTVNDEEQPIDQHAEELLLQLLAAPGLGMSPTTEFDPPLSATPEWSTEDLMPPPPAKVLIDRVGRALMGVRADDRLPGTYSASIAETEEGEERRIDIHIEGEDSFEWYYTVNGIEHPFDEDAEILIFQLLESIEDSNGDSTHEGGGE